MQIDIPAHKALITSAAVAVEAREAETTAAAALLDRLVEMLTPGIRRAMIRASGEVRLGGEGRLDESRGQHSVRGRVSGTAYVLTADGIVRRTYSGAHSEFSEYHNVTYRDRPSTARDVVTWSTAGVEYDLRTAVSAIASALARVADATVTAAARTRAQRYKQILSTL